MDVNRGPLVLLGPTMKPEEAFELSGRHPHLILGMKKHYNRAMKLATRMKELDSELKIICPGLEDYPQHKLMDSMRNKGYGFGAILCIDMKAIERANKLIEKLQNKTLFGFIDVSLGCCETLMSCPASSTGIEMDEDEKKRAGLSPVLIRFYDGYLVTLDQKGNQFKQANLVMKN